MEVLISVRLSYFNILTERSLPRHQNVFSGDVRLVAITKSHDIGAGPQT